MAGGRSGENISALRYTFLSRRAHVNLL